MGRGVRQGVLGVGDFASSKESSTWLTYDAATALAATKGLAGIGFVFNGDGITGVDFDHCRDKETGALEPWAQKWIDRLASYTEISPSGTGLHVFVRATLPGPGRNREGSEGGKIEVYDRARYFTVTGEHFPGTPATIEPRQDVINDLYARLGAEPAADKAVAANTLSAADDCVVAKIEASQDSPSFHRLFTAGETRPNRTDSENDIELAAILCRYAATDEQVERIMRASPLRRDKWDRRGDDYLARTIRSARRKTGTTATTDGTVDAGFVDFGTVHDAPPPAVGWLVEHIWPEGARGWIAGEAKLGKSWLALELAVCVATGEPFLGKYAIAQPGRVFYLTEESNLRNIYNRLRMILLAKGLSPDSLRDRLRLLVRKRVKLTDPSWRTRIVTAIDAEKPVVLFLDPLRRYHDGGENDSGDLVAVLDAAAEFQERPDNHRVAVPIVHHMRKTSEANSDARAGQQMRGSSDLHAWGDAALYCTGIKDNRNVVNVEVELKDAEPPMPFVVGIEYGEPQDVLVGGEQIEMRAAALSIRAEQTMDDVRVRDAADDILAFLSTQAERQTVTAITSAVRRKAMLIRPALQLLRREGKADMVKDGKSNLWAARGTPAPRSDADDSPY